MRTNVRAMAFVASVLSMGYCSVAAAVDLGLINDFSDDTVQGWAGHTPSISNVPSGGPNGDGSDNFLRVVSDGVPPGRGDGGGGTGPNAGTKLAVLNTGAAWAGDYTAAEVGAIQIDAKNFSAENDAFVRLAFSSNGGQTGNWWVTIDPFVLPKGGTDWQRRAIRISEEDLEQVSGTATYAFTFANIAEVRILVNSEINFQGETQTHEIGLDNLTVLGPVVEDGIFSEHFESPPAAPM